MTRDDEWGSEVVELSWKAHPLRERLQAGILASVLILALAGAIYVSFQSPGWSFLAVVVLVLALNRFYFPSRFVIDREGITARYLLSRKRYRWSSVRRFLYDRQGAFLSTRGRRSWFDAFSGLNILFGSHRAEVIDLIRRHLKEAPTQ
jgi:hypothetical protein